MEKVQQFSATTAATVAASVVASRPFVEKIIRDAGAAQHEQIRQMTSGMSADEMGRAGKLSTALARQFKMNETDVAGVIRNAKTIAGTFDAAASIMPSLLKLQVAYKASRPNASPEEVSRESENILRAADLMGATANPEKFKKFIAGVGKTQFVFGDSVSPAAMFAAAQHAGAAPTRWSEDFITGALPSLIQTMGGDSAGTSLGSMFSAIVGGRMKLKSAKILNQLGLLDPKKIVRNKIGDVAGIMPGGVMGSELALSNPFLYATQIVGPALAKKGITDPNKITETLAGAFSDKKVAQVMTHFILNKGQVERDISLARGAMDFDKGVSKILQSDLGPASEGLKNSLTSLAAVAGQPFLTPLTEAINTLATVAANATDQLRGDNSLASHTALGAAGAVGLAGAVAGMGGLGMMGIGPGAMATAGAAGPLGALGAMGLAGHYFWNDAKKGQNASYWNPIAAVQNLWNSSDSSPQTATRGAVAPGALGFGFGNAGVGNLAALNTQPAVGGLASALRGAGQQVRLEGAANISNTVTIEASPDFITKIIQAVKAEGNLRADTGVSMAP